MPEPILDANQEDSSASLETAIGDSVTPEEVQQHVESQTPTAEQGDAQPELQQETEEVPFHKHPRFKELIEENRWLKQNMEQIIQQRQQQQVQQPTQNPYAGMTPDEERFWRAVDDRAKTIARSELQSVTPLLEAGRAELAQMKVMQFRAEHPDVKPDSPEEIAIARKISSGYAPDDAYRAVMWDSKFKTSEEKSKQQVKQRIEAKRQANVEQTSMPAKQGLPPTNEKLSLRQRIEKNLNLIEQGKL